MRLYDRISHDLTDRRHKPVVLRGARLTGNGIPELHTIPPAGRSATLAYIGRGNAFVADTPLFSASLNRLNYTVFRGLRCVPLGKNTLGTHHIHGRPRKR